MPFIVGLHRQEAIPQKGQIRRILEVRAGEQSMVGPSMVFDCFRKTIDGLSMVKKINK